MTRVVFPCDQDTWWQVKDGLHTLKELSQQPGCDLRTLAEAHQSVVNTSQGLGENAEAAVLFNHCAFYGLAKFFRKHATPDERSHFLQSTLPWIIDMALKVEILLPGEGIAISEQQKCTTTVIERQLCCAVLACAFLCLFPPSEDRGYKKKLNTINFKKFFDNLPIPSQNAKLRCILHFFDRVTAEWSRLTGMVFFTRQVVKRNEMPTLDTWLNCTSELCDVEIHEDGVIEDAGCDAVEVDFANRCIGGGVLGRGRVQEEIRFTVCPELIVSMLFMEVMEDNEAIIIRGYEQFSQTEGYAADLQFVGDYNDPLHVDENGNLRNTLCAIDAVSYRFKGNTNNQYQDQAVLRELNKAFTGFCTPFTIPPSENWSEEDFYTADEDSEVDSRSSAPCEPPKLYHIHLFAEDLLQRALNLAIPEAAACISLEHSSASQNAEGSTSDEFGEEASQKLHDEIQMAHLEVNFRDWNNRYRRRSSNLSDLSSRRSSYDLSRRSSACSTREYGSEFSSEFEEFFENFQQQEQRYKYHTIKEEVGCSAVNEFAANLAASLLRQGTLEACHNDSAVQMFHGEPPTNVSQPRAIKLSSSGSTDDAKEISEESARKFVDGMFCGLWPFDSGGTIISSNVDSQNEVKDEIMDGFQMQNENLDTLQNTENEVDENDLDSSCVTEADSLISDTDGAHTHYVAGLSEEDILVEVADRIVALAFEEALAEFRYRYVSNYYGRLQEQISFESVQSEHSSEQKDQSQASTRAQLLAVSQAEPANRALATYSTSAATVADQMMQGIFGPGDSTKGSSRDRSLVVGQPINVSHQGQPSNFGHEGQLSNIPNIETCDKNNKTQLCINSGDNKTRLCSNTENLSISHSTSVRDTSKQTSKQLEMYNRIADRLLSEGFSSKVADKNRSTDSGNAVSIVNPLSDQSYRRNSLHDQQIDQSQISDRNAGTRTSPSVHSFSSQLSSPNFAEDNHVADSHRKTDERISRSRSLKSKSSKSSQSAVCRNSSSSSEGKSAINKCDKSSVGHSPGSSRQGKENITPPSGNSVSPVNQSTGSDKTGSESSALKTGSQTGIYNLSVEDKKQAGARPKARIHMLERQNAFNNKEDYDQFANSLSRDLLTNAFLQVQDHRAVINYPRRSSEPMQISNGAALQRFEHSIQSLNGRRGHKSKTDEDIWEFEDEWSRYVVFGDNGYDRSSTGFRDPVLSRFAEELMKANVSVPTLQLLSDCLSTSGSSRSMCSTVSSFRDPLLASFEDELLSSSIKSSARTQMSWSKLKGNLCSSRQSEQRGSQNSNHSNKHSGNSSVGDIDVNGMAWRSGKSNSVVVCSEGVSDFADVLSQRIVHEAITVAFRSVGDTGTPYMCLDLQGRHRATTVEDYGEMLARKILRSAISTAENQTACSDWLEQNKIVTWSEETECLEYSGEENTDTSEGEDDRLSMVSSDTASTSLEYQDALDVPFYRLEEFADRLAARVLVNSVAMSRREQLSALRRRYGRHIATGNWGCGAFCGDPHLKSLLQWMAASYAGTPCMMYYTFRNPLMVRFQEVVDVVRDRGWDVSKLMQAVRRYCITVQISGTRTHDLFDVILQGEVFPGI